MMNRVRHLHFVHFLGTTNDEQSKIPCFRSLLKDKKWWTEFLVPKKYLFPISFFFLVTLVILMINWNVITFPTLCNNFLTRYCYLIFIKCRSKNVGPFSVGQKKSWILKKLVEVLVAKLSNLRPTKKLQAH